MSRYQGVCSGAVRQRPDLPARSVSPWLLLFLWLWPLLWLLLLCGARASLSAAPPPVNAWVRDADPAARPFDGLRPASGRARLAVTDVRDVGARGATLVGAAEAPLGALLCFSVRGGPADRSFETAPRPFAGPGTGGFVESLRGRLEPERAYAVRLIWRQGGEEVVSEPVWFTTLADDRSPSSSPSSPSSSLWLPSSSPPPAPAARRRPEVGPGERRHTPPAGSSSGQDPS